MKNLATLVPKQLQGFHWTPLHPRISGRLVANPILGILICDPITLDVPCSKFVVVHPAEIFTPSKLVVVPCWLSQQGCGYICIWRISREQAVPRCPVWYSKCWVNDPFFQKVDPSEVCFGCHRRHFLVKNAFSWKPKKLTKSTVRISDVSLV